MGTTVESALPQESAAEQQGGGAALAASGRTADQSVTEAASKVRKEKTMLRIG